MLISYQKRFYYFDRRPKVQCVIGLVAKTAHIPEKSIWCAGNNDFGFWVSVLNAVVRSQMCFGFRYYLRITIQPGHVLFKVRRFWENTQANTCNTRQSFYQLPVHWWNIATSYGLRPRESTFISLILTSLGSWELFISSARRDSLPSVSFSVNSDPLYFYIFTYIRSYITGRCSSMRDRIVLQSLNLLQPILWRSMSLTLQWTRELRQL